MCLIILREPNVTLDFDKFKTCVDNNPHGWGISVPDGEGSLYTYRQVDPDNDTDAEELYEYIHDEFKDNKFMLHLRYTTAGETVLRNAHPFPVLEKAADGVDLRMAHNGTLHAYEPKWNAENKWESDTRVFNRRYVRPLFKRLIMGRDIKSVLEDGFTEFLVDNELTALSVATFISGTGETLCVNAKGNGGFVADDGTYYSNKYSFDENHRKPKSYTMGGSSSTKGKTGASTHSTKQTSGHSTTKTKTTVSTDLNQETFSELYGLSNKDDLFQLSDETIELLVSEEPEDAEALIKELLFRLQKAENKHQRASRLLASKIKIIEKLQEEDESKGEQNGQAIAV